MSKGFGSGNLNVRAKGVKVDAHDYGDADGALYMLRFAMSVTNPDATGDYEGYAGLTYTIMAEDVADLRRVIRDAQAALDAMPGLTVEGDTAEPEGVPLSPADLS